MVEIISGEKGKGKTKQLLDRVRGDVKNAQGSIVFLDKNQKHMYELDSKVRLINMADYDVESSDEFLGFLSGVISQNNDIEEIFLDSFLTIGYIDTSEGLVRAVEKLDKMSEKFETNFILSVSKDERASGCRKTEDYHLIIIDDICVWIPLFLQRNLRFYKK